MFVAAAIAKLCQPECPALQPLFETALLRREARRRFRDLAPQAAQRILAAHRLLPSCPVPAHCMDRRRLPRFIARSALRDLIAGLQADAKGVQAAC